MFHLVFVSRLHSTVPDNNFCGLDQYLNNLNTLPRNWNLRQMVCARSVSFSTALRPRFIASSQRHKPRHYRDSWAKTSVKKETRGVRRCDPLSARRAHYLSADQMDQIIAGTRSNYASFGGVMLWDAYVARCECAHVNLDLNLSLSQAESSTFSSVRLHSSPGIASQTLAVTYSHALVF